MLRTFEQSLVICYEIHEIKYQVKSTCNNNDCYYYVVKDTSKYPILDMILSVIIILSKVSIKIRQWSQLND